MLVWRTSAPPASQTLSQAGWLLVIRVKINFCSEYNSSWGFQNPESLFIEMLIRFLFCFEMRGSCFFISLSPLTCNLVLAVQDGLCRWETLMLWPGWKCLLDVLFRGARAGCEWFKQGQQSSLHLFGLAPSSTRAFFCFQSSSPKNKGLFYWGRLLQRQKMHL